MIAKVVLVQLTANARIVVVRGGQFLLGFSCTQIWLPLGTNWWTGRSGRSSGCDRGGGGGSGGL